MTTFSTTDYPTDVARHHVAARVAAFLDGLRRDALHDLDHLRSVSASYEQPLELADVPAGHWRQILDQHNARRDQHFQALADVRDRLAAINEAIGAL